MLTEQGLIVMATLVACALVVLGTLELIAPSRPRRARRPASLDPGYDDGDPEFEDAPELAARPLIAPFRAMAPPPAATAEPAAPASRPPAPAPAAPVAPPEPALPLFATSAPSVTAAAAPGTEPPIERILRTQAEELSGAAPAVLQPPEPAKPRPAARRVRQSPRPDRFADIVTEAAAVADGGDFAAARLKIAAALDDPQCPAEAQATLREAFAAFAAREAGQLTADAIRRIDGSETDAMSALVRAEAFLAELPGDAVAPRRRRELERRLWWGYTKLGSRWTERGRWDEALEPLLRALAFQEVGAERQDETREQLSRAVNGLIDARAATVESLTESGDREGARAVWELLRAVLDTAVERGLDPDTLEQARARMDALVDRVGAGVS
jgi:hypothetical protein